MRGSLSRDRSIGSRTPYLSLLSIITILIIIILSCVHALRHSALVEAVN